ncbi:ATP-binding cassette domain-containing protein [Telmatospirillum sp.]|uniref:ABC transporter ATP-binding protein n=1 Tax=Telmatospirillum sp. TaxID=2079197 RepID=UPI00284B82C4|nr:ATP-binding cassette domain-containing protein [Telmatospirillum sp.]MDR3434990.1 ATP-binding cassette domain-containing protein [Telmatospirillum sp.]
MLAAEDLRFQYGRQAPWVVDGIDLAVEKGEVVGLIGPSGIGKSTLGRLLAGHLEPLSGRILADGEPLPRAGICPVQLIFQHPEFAVNPRWPIRKIISEAWTPDARILDMFGIKPNWYDRFPYELSGGELQRVTLVRALAPGVNYLVCDEITAMLDAIAQVTVWRALIHVIAERGIGIVAISHDPALLDIITNRIVALPSRWPG